MSYMNDDSGSDEDESDKEGDSTVESLEGSNDDSSSSEKEGSSVLSAECNDIEYNHKGAGILLNIHDQLDLDKLQKMKRFFIADDDTSGAYAELDMKQFSDALRSVLPNAEELADEDLGLLFMKIDANGSGDIDWDEFTGFLLQLDEGNRNMAAAAQMSDLKPLPGSQRAGAGEHTGQHRDMIEKIINVERPGVSAYVTCGRDGTIKFWHKGTFAPFRTIRYLDAMKAAYEVIIMGREVEGNGRRVCSAQVNRAVKSMKCAWVYDIQQMPLSNRIAAACFDRTVSFYDILTGEFVCRIGGLRSSPTCVDCVQIGTNEQQVIFGDLDGVLHVWSFGKHFYIPGLQDTREAADLNGNFSLPMHSGAISCLGYVADLNATVTCGMDGKVHFVDLMKRRVTRTFGGHVERPVFAFAYSKRHRFVVSAGLGRAVVFWNSYTMHVLARRDGHGATVRHCLVDDRSDRVITISADKAVRCWDSATFRCIQSFKDHRMHRPDDTISAALWDHSRSSLIVAGNRLGVWKNKGAIQTSKHTHEAPVTAALYNSHFHQVVSGDAFGNVHVWLIETGLLAFRFGKAHGTSKISCMGFDASERRLLTGANDGTVKMWNFNNGKELRLLQSGAGVRRKGENKNAGNERNEVSGLVWCRDGKGSENESLDIVATCSWDQQVRVFAMDPGHHTHFAAQHNQCGQATNITVPSRVFPGEDRPLQQQQGRHGSDTRGKSVRMGGGSSSRKDGGEGGSGGTTGPGKGHSADILAIAHCGHQQVATAGFDGQIFVWATESGKAKFSMKPSDHDVSKFDEVSSIGGLTSVARLMVKQRKKMGHNVDRDSVDSGGYLDRMEILLAEDASVSRISWDGREYFAEERMGGSNDGSGTGQAANVATDHDPEDGSAAEGAETPAAEAAAETTTTGAKASAQEMAVISEETTAVGDGSVNADDTDGVRELGSAPRKGGTLSSPDADVATPKSSTVPLTMLPAEDALEAGDDSPAGAPATGASNGAVRPLPSDPRASDGSKAPGILLNGVLHQPETAATASQPGNRKDAAPGGSSEKGEKKSASGRGRQTSQRAGDESKVAENSGGSARSNDDDAPKNAATRKKEEGGMEELLESTVSHTVDCLIYIRCHGVLCSGTASGELHFWDASSGAFIFGVAARHPNNPGLTAMSSNEGSLEGGGGGGVKPDTSEGRSGSVGISGVGAPATTAAEGGAPAVASGSVDLMLYTACEEGFVKTWRVGDITEQAYQTGLRARPKPPRKARGGRAGKGSSGEAAAPPPSPVLAAGSPGAANQAMPQISLLQPMHQWQAHKTSVTSVDGGNFRGKLDLLITAGDDCFVHVWTVAGAHVGTFGQPTAWSLGSRATWREPTDRALCSTYGQNKLGEEDEQSSSVTSSTAGTTTATTTGEQESTATSQGGSKRLRRMASKLGKATSTTASEGEKESRQAGRKPENSRARISQDRDLEKERQEAERYQEKRYYIASQNRVQRKLLRGRLSAFCVSRDYYKKEKIQEASQILSDTVKKTSLHPQPSSMRHGLSKNRITSILRNTYNQVSFQLQLHKHEDVHDRAEVALTRRKSRRRAKAASNAAGHQHHHRLGGTPGTNHSSSRTATAGAATSRTVSRATAAEDVAGGSMKAMEDATVPRGDSRDGGGARGGSKGGGGGGDSISALLAGSTDTPSKDHQGGARPAVPVDPLSSSAASARHFRRTSTAGA